MANTDKGDYLEEGLKILGRGTRDAGKVLYKGARAGVKVARKLKRKKKKENEYDI